ncbi:MAG TPA: FAD-binding oxidoreductase [Candidatus Limnocylindrales bacterium]|nr:FAD-binding oxidoreductase [Candidatus Limnocylindrales bacterium]
MTELANATAPGIVAAEDERYNASLVRRVDQHENLGYFWVKFDGDPTPFEPGQYMTIGVFVDGRIVQRPYSVASAPVDAGDTGYEMYLRLVQGGTFTPILWDLPVGHRMRMIGPKGKFMLEPDDDRVHVFVSSGTGNAPFIAMMRQMLADGRPRKAVFLNGVSYARDLGYRDLVEGWESSGEYPVRYIPTVSRPNDPANAGWTGRTGRVETIVSPIFDELGLRHDDTVAYLCGNPDMIISAEQTLLELGMGEDAVKKELYWPKGKEPRGATGADLAAAIEAAEANADQ